MDLPTLRQRIDAVDDQLLALLTTRAGLIRDVVAAKRAADIPTHAAAREASMFSRLRERATTLGLDPDYIHELWSLIIVHTKEIECGILQTDTIYAHEAPPPEELRLRLLELTRRVADAYHQYRAGESSDALQLYLGRESNLLQNAIRTLDRRQVVLDLGCATGQVTEILEPSFAEVLACDVSPGMIQAAVARRRWAPDTHFTVGDAADILADREDISLVVANFGAASELWTPGFLPAIARALAPGGRALLSFYNAEALSTTWYHPWPSTLHARLNPLNDTLEVWYDAEVFTIYGHGMTAAGLREAAAAAGLAVLSLETYPTVLAILPHFFFRSPRFRKAVSTASALDDTLAATPPYAGTYLLTVLGKTALAEPTAARPGGWGEGEVRAKPFGIGFGDRR